MDILLRCLNEIREHYWNIKKKGKKPNYEEIVKKIYQEYEHMLEGMSCSDFKSKISLLRERLKKESEKKKEVRNKDVPIQKILQTKATQLYLF